MTASIAEGRAYWPATAADLHDQTVGELLRSVAARHPDATGLIGGDPAVGELRRWTFAEMVSDSEQIARALLARFDPGDRVAIWAHNIPEWVLIEFGAALAGITLVTVNPAFLPAEAEYVLTQSKARGLLVVDQYRGADLLATAITLQASVATLEVVVRLDDWEAFVRADGPDRDLPNVDPSDPFQIQYTSGTTGFPKGALLHHRGVVNNSRLAGDRMELTELTPYVNPMPMFHTGGCVLGTLIPLHRGCAQVCVYAFDAAEVLRLIEAEGASGMMVVPTMLIALTEHPDFAARDLSSLKSIMCGGSTVPADLVRLIESTVGAEVSIVFGQTEASPVITQSRPSDSPQDKAETIGQPLPATEVKIVDPATGETVGCGEVGEFCARGYFVMEGYFEMPAATSEAIDSDGWLHTGDLASMDERGFCRVEGRLKDMIIRGGENIYPREIEAVLFAHPDIADAAVVGLPDPRWGEIVVAYLRPASDRRPSDEELRRYARERLAPFKTPVRWRWVDAFPLTASGKIKKFELRDAEVADGD